MFVLECGAGKILCSSEDAIRLFESRRICKLECPSKTQKRDSVAWGWMDAGGEMSASQASAGEGQLQLPQTVVMTP
jgi:hypothetical protein